MGRNAKKAVDAAEAIAEKADDVVDVSKAAPPVKAPDPEPPTKAADNTKRTEADTDGGDSCPAGGPFCSHHGGESGSPDGEGIVEGPVPAKATEMLQKVKDRKPVAEGQGLGKVPGYEGKDTWQNNKIVLPGGKYREWDVNKRSSLPRCAADGCNRVIRGGQRIVTPKTGPGNVYYTPDHYATFFYVGRWMPM